MKFYSVKVEERRRLGAYSVLGYRWPHPIEPGQFVMARGAGYPVTLDPFLARPLSVYDHDGEIASLLFEVRGRGTALLDSDTHEIEVSAPLGLGFRTEGIEGPVALLGGGVGVAPMKVLGRRLTETETPHDVFLGFADAGPAAAARDFPGATVATMDGSVGVRGTVLDAAPDLAGYSAVYACGPTPMLAAVKHATARANGRRVACQLSVEERMGCGNGSCNGCVVPVNGRGYVRSCVEGPVFDAEVLAW